MSFLSAKKADANLIFLNDVQTFIRVQAATLLAKELNLTEKESRVDLFDMIIATRPLLAWKKLPSWYTQ